jgi:dihydrofolate synthase/folylpolyglutamate synthase
LVDYKRYSLDQWLSHIQNQHWRSIDLKLDRIQKVWDKLQGSRSNLVITVAGTNGKGSSVAMIESVIRNAGLRTGSYTSPHLVRYNERVCIDGTPVSDQMLIDAFIQIEDTREGIPLTYFEFGTLCALLIFMQQKVDVSILETGMGGRLDAVNMIDNDIALITSIGLDHQQWLGNDREKIGAEKAGVIKPHGIAICSDPNPPMSLSMASNSVAATLLRLGTDFKIDGDENGIITWSGSHNLIPADWRRIAKLKSPFFGRHQVNNLAGVIATVAVVSEKTGLTVENLFQGLSQVSLPGRTQVILDAPMIVLDVAHNADSAEELAHYLAAHPVEGQTHAVTGILKDKALKPIFSCIKPHVDQWYLASLDGERGQTASDLAQKFTDLYPDAALQQFPSPVEAYLSARSAAVASDRIIVFGSFYTVGDIIELFEQDSYLI